MVQTRIANFFLPKWNYNSPIDIRYTTRLAAKGFEPLMNHIVAEYKGLYWFMTSRIGTLSLAFDNGLRKLRWYQYSTFYFTFELCIKSGL